MSPYSIVAGMPARHRKWRFSKELIQELLSVRWWDYELGDMFREGLDFSDPASFLSKFLMIKGNIRKAGYSKLPIYSYSLFGKDISIDKNIIIDHRREVLCLDPSSMRVVHKSVEFLCDSFPIEIKKMPQGLFLYVENLGFLDVDENLSFKVREHGEVFSCKVRKVNSDMQVCIEINGRYLCSLGLGTFRLQPHVKDWEIYKLPIGIG